MRIRLATAEDGEAVAAVYRPIVSDTHISFETDPPDGDEMGRRIAESWPWYPWLVAEDGPVLGYAYAAQHRPRPAYRWAVDVSVYVDPDARRRGIGRRLYRVLLESLARQGYRTAHAGIALPNPASVAFHQSFGFQPVGVYRRVGWKLGSWRDVGWWQLALSASDEPPVQVATIEAAGLVDPHSDRFHRVARFNPPDAG